MAPPKPKATKRKAATKPVVVRIDPKLKRQWDEAVKQLNHARSQGAQAYDVYWEAVADILDHTPPLYLAGGIATETEFLRQHVPENRATAYHHMKVARLATPKDEEQYGPSKLLALITWLEAKNGGPLKAPVDFSRIKIPVERDGRHALASAADATIDDLRDAQRALESKARSSRKTSPVEQAIEKLVLSAGLKATQFRFARDVATFRVPVAKLAAFGSKLATFTPPR